MVYDKRTFSCRFGAIVLDKKDTVIGFQEKPKSEEAWVNVGFLV